MDRGLDVWLIPKFSGAATDLPIEEWIENMELVCELCEMTRAERVLPLKLKAGALAVYYQLTKEQRSDAEQIKQALINAYVTDPFNAFKQFTMRQLHPGETVEFLGELKYLALLVGGLLSERWMICTFISGLPQQVRQLLRASTRIDTMTLDQILT